MSNFPFMNPPVVQYHLTDPGSDDEQIALLRAPARMTIRNAYVWLESAQASGSAGAFTVLNYGTGGTAVKAGDAGTVVATLGGTGTAVRMAAGTPIAGSVVSGEVLAGEWVILDYQETGDFVEGVVTIVLDAVYGQG